GRVLCGARGGVYGGHARWPVEEAQTAEPGSPYGRAKLSGERVCAAWTRTTGLETVCLRYFNVFGPRQPENSPYAPVVHTSITAMLAGRSPILPKEAGSDQDLIYVEDA